MGDQQEILNTILLTRLNYFSLAGMLELYRKVGSATLILEHKNNLRDLSLIHISEPTRLPVRSRMPSSA